MGFSLGRKEENMKQFNAQRVAGIAIDKREHQQLYVQDKIHRQKIFDTLFEMGFTSRYISYVYQNLLENKGEDNSWHACQWMNKKY
jgi:SOS response regulatory protein OraA/RecX